MKKLIFSLLAIVMVITVGKSQESQKIGVVQEGKFFVTEDISNIGKEWKTLLLNQKIDDELTSFTIESGMDTELKDEVYYFLLGKTKNNVAKVAVQLTLEKGVFYIDSESMVPGTVTCSGCSYACNPQKIRGQWMCSIGCGSNCTKSVSIRGQVSTN